jgi:hypothetical protein
MPPQQSHGLLDVIDNGLDFGAHGCTQLIPTRKLVSGWSRGKVAMREGGAMTERLIGTWTLVSAVREEIPSGEKSDQMGPNPHGFLTYGPDGRMIALLVRRDRTAPANGRATPAEADALFRSMLSYAGPYTFDGREVIHHVDISWNESFTGSLQRRFVAFEGEVLKLSTPQSLDPIDGKLSVRTMTWKRVK